MSNKTVSGYVNLIHKLAIALSEGEAEAEVQYVPVSRTPYLRVALGREYDGLDDLRERMCLALATRGFIPGRGTGLSKSTGSGFLSVDVGAPYHDRTTGKAFLRVGIDGPYSTAQDGTGSPRDKRAERAAFAAAVAETEMRDFHVLSGMQSMVRILVTSAPFAVAPAISARLSRCRDMAVLHRVARAFGKQCLTCQEDLVQALGPTGVPGLEPGVVV